jgi:hypothetical protein
LNSALAITQDLRIDQTKELRAFRVLCLAPTIKIALP